MKKLIIAFDIDGTILNNEAGTPIPKGMIPSTTSAINIEITLLLQILSKAFKNTKIYVWSGGGQDYAEQMVIKYGLSKYVDRCFGKHEYDETVDGRVDLAIDDQHEFGMADKNLIVRMK